MLIKFAREIFEKFNSNLTEEVYLINNLNIK